VLSTHAGILGDDLQITRQYQHLELVSVLVMFFFHLKEKKREEILQPYCWNPKMRGGAEGVPRMNDLAAP
jgi:hypothetical protein